MGVAYLTWHIEYVQHESHTFRGAMCHIYLVLHVPQDHGVLYVWYIPHIVPLMIMLSRLLKQMENKV